MQTWKKRHKDRHNFWMRLYTQRPDVKAQAMVAAIKRRTGKSPHPRLELLIFKGIMRDKCSLCGLPFKLDSRDMTLAPSVDKRNPHAGYEPANIQVVHFECNRIKGKLPQRIVKTAIRGIMRKAYGHLFRREISSARTRAAYATRCREDRKSAAKGPGQA